jgi:endonuclease/exonuclease/phosphatase family metal-dependent hydrolase
MEARAYGPRIRLLTYNVRYFSHSLRGAASTRSSQRRIAQAIAALEPVADVLCLQEVESASLRSRATRRCAGPQASQLDGFLADLKGACAALGKACHYRGLYFPGHVTRLWRMPVASCGLAILVHEARFQITSHNADAPWSIPSERVDPLRGPRICAHVRLVDPRGQPLHVFNAHLSLPLPLPQLLFWRLPRRLGYAGNQLAESRAVAKLIRGEVGHEPFVLCGDFNATPGSPVLRHLTDDAGFHVARRARLPDGSREPTFSAMGVALQLDYLFCGGGAAWFDIDGTYPVDAREGPFMGLSDHVPVVARLAVRVNVEPQLTADRDLRVMGAAHLSIRTKEDA